ncbi:MAG: Peptide-methionine (R)-S-oxide reductase MsrB, partial [uncultured Sphingomonas sp.]
AARREDRTSTLQPAQRGEAPWHLRLCRLRPPGLQVAGQVRERHRLAELHRADPRGRAHPSRRHRFSRPHRSALPPLRWSPGSRVRRRPPADRQALLHERRGNDLQRRV